MEYPVDGLRGVGWVVRGGDVLEKKGENERKMRQTKVKERT